MLMSKVRAQSYVRRTISQPAAAKRRQTALRERANELARLNESGSTDVGMYNLLSENASGIGAPSRQLHLQLLTSDVIQDEDLNVFASFSKDGSSSLLPTEGNNFTLLDDLAGVVQLFLSPINILLLFVPLGFLSQAYSWSTGCIFWFNFAALIPLAALLGAATEELALHTGDVLGGLLNATFGNAVELILSVHGLRSGLITVVQDALLGSILSNLLFVLGAAFFLGGMSHHVQHFNEKGATCNTSLLLLSSIGITIPTIRGLVDSSLQGAKILIISRMTALLIMVAYVLFLFFQLCTHVTLFSEDDDGEADEWPSMSWIASISVLVVVTMLISVHSEYLVRSIDKIVTNYNMSRDFIGLILLPIVGNAAEHATAVTVAIKDKMDLTIAVALGSSTQIALFVVPFVVIVGWVLGIPMTLAFPPLSAAILTLSILVVLGIVQDGESNWLEGVMLLTAYLILAVSYW